MSYDIGPRIGIEGDTQYRAALKAIVSQTKALTTEMESVTSAFTKADSKEAKLTAQNKVLQKQIETTKQKISLLTTEYEKQKKKLDELDTALEKAKTEFGENSEEAAKAQNAYNRQADNVNRLAAQLNSAEAELNKMNAQLKNNTDSLKQFGEKATEAGRNLTAIGDGAKEVGSTLTKSITAPLAGVATAAVKVGMDFDAAMSEVAAISGATGEDLEALRAKAEEMGASTKFSATESAEALKYMALAGWNTSQMIDALPAVLNLAAAAGMDLGEASDIVTDYLTAFGLSAEDATGFVDQMAYAMANSNTDVTMLGEAYKNCAASAASMGYSVEDTTAVLMTMADAGIKGGEAGTALNTIMTRLATNTSGCADTLAEYGVQIYDSEGNMNDLSSILNGVADMWGKLTDEQQASIAKTIAGTNQYSALQTVMNGLGDDAVAAGKSFNDYAAALEDCDETAQNMADTMQDNLAGQLTTLKSTVEGIGIQISNILTPKLSDAVTKIQEVATAFSNLPEGTKKTVVAITGVAAVIGPAIAVIGGIISSVGGIATAIGGVATAAATGTGMVSAIGTAIGALAGPVALATVGIAAAAIAIVTHWDDIKQKAAEMKDAVTGKLGELATAASEKFSTIGEAAGAAKDAVAEKLSAIGDAVQGALDTAAGVVQVGLMLIGEVISAGVQIITLPWQFLWQNFGAPIAEYLAPAAEAVKTKMTEIKDVISGRLTEAATVASEKWSEIS